MKAIRSTVLVAAAGLLGSAVYLGAQQGPQSQSSETVAKPRKKDTNTTPGSTTDNPDLPKIPSKFSTKDKVATEGLPTFKSDVTTVQVDVAVLDNKGRFIPRIPRGNFRILEDGQPQQISGFSVGN